MIYYNPVVESDSSEKRVFDSKVESVCADVSISVINKLRTHRYFPPADLFHQDQFYNHFIDTLTLYATLTLDTLANILTGFAKLFDLIRNHFQIWEYAGNVAFAEPEKNESAPRVETAIYLKR